MNGQAGTGARTRKDGIGPRTATRNRNESGSSHHASLYSADRCSRAVTVYASVRQTTHEKAPVSAAHAPPRRASFSCVESSVTPSRTAVKSFLPKKVMKRAPGAAGSPRGWIQAPLLLSRQSLLTAHRKSHPVPQLRFPLSPQAGMVLCLYRRVFSRSLWLFRVSCYLPCLLSDCYFPSPGNGG